MHLTWPQRMEKICTDAEGQGRHSGQRGRHMQMPGGRKIEGGD